MKAMVLAGGLSTRLYPLTKSVPKPLVPILGEPVSAHVLRLLAAHGFTDVSINVHYLADQIEAAFGDGSAYGVHLNYLHEKELTGSAGALKGLDAHFRDGTFLVIGCDDLTDADLGAIVAFHRSRGAVATIGVVEAEDVEQYGVVVTDEHGRITGFQEKPARGTERSKLANTGIYVFEPAVLDRIPAGTFYDFGKQVFPEMLRDGVPFYAMRFENTYWRDVGTPDEYRQATADALQGRVKLHNAPRRIATSATIASDAEVADDVVIGEGARIGSGARIAGPSVVGAGAAVDADAVLERAIVWDRARIGAGATVVDTIVGSGYQVAPGSALVDTIVAIEPVTA